MCVACLEETPVAVIFNCESNTSHCMCCECARRMVSGALLAHNFNGCSMCVTLDFEISCPLCRRKVYTNPFKKLPTEIYKFYDGTTEVPFTCVRCAAQHAKCETHVDHVLYNCPKDVFECHMCHMNVKWNVMDTQQLLQHIHDNECTGVVCGCRVRGGECTFAGTFAAAAAHHESHHVRKVLERRFTDFIRNRIDIAHLPNMLGIDLDSLAQRPPPESLMEQYNSIAATEEEHIEPITDDDDNDSDDDDDDDDEDSEPPIPLAPVRVRLVHAEVVHGDAHSHAPSGSM